MIWEFLLVSFLSNDLIAMLNIGLPICEKRLFRCSVHYDELSSFTQCFSNVATLRQVDFNMNSNEQRNYPGLRNTSLQQLSKYTSGLQGFHA